MVRVTPKFMKTKLIACAAILAFHSAAFAGGEGWSSDFAAAKKEATESKKDLLVDFTGSDWCGVCIVLNKEVFSQEPFKAGVKDSFVLVEVDFPKDKSKLSEDTIKQNEELMQKYSIQSFPQIVLCDADGKPFAATGYQPGGPEAYVKHLNELRANKGKRDEAFASAAKKEGLDKAKTLVAGLAAMGLEDNFVTGAYGDVVEQIKASDPKDETGFVKAAAMKARLAAFYNELMAFGQKKDHDGALGAVDKILKEGGFETEKTQEIMLIRAQIFVQQQKFDEAIKAVEEAKAFAPDSQKVQEIMLVRAQIFAQQQKFDEGFKALEEARAFAPKSQKVQEIILTRALFLAQQQKFDDALKVVEEAKAFDPESGLKAGIEQFKAQLEAAKKKAEEAKPAEGEKSAEDKKPAAGE